MFLLASKHAIGFFDVSSDLAETWLPDGKGGLYRRPYNMRHTYATIGLMSGAKPGFLADQLGHSLRMFFEVYARWLRSIDDKLEVAKIDGAIKQQFQNNSKARNSSDKDE